MSGDKVGLKRDLQSESWLSFIKWIYNFERQKNVKILKALCIMYWGLESEGGGGFILRDLRGDSLPFGRKML